MKWSRGLLHARHHIAFITGLSLAILIAWQAEVHMPRPIQAWIDNFSEVLRVTDDYPQPIQVPTELTDEEKEWALIAWSYFQNNYQEETGLVNSVDGYPSTTLWDLGSYLMGILSARELGIVTEEELTTRVSKMLRSLATIDLVQNKLPNKAYNTQTMKMVDYNNKPVDGGIGWSGIDVARFGVPLQIIVWRHSQMAPLAKQVINRWDFDSMVKDGQLVTGAVGKNGEVELFQEGRFGYEQYAAKSLSFLGLDVTKAGRYDVGVEVIPVEGQYIAYDERLPRFHEQTHNAVLSEPYILEGVEFGYNAITLPLAQSVLQAQINRFENTGILTAVSEDNIDQSPWFVYYSVLNDLEPWAIFDPSHNDASEFRTVSTKAAMGWAKLFSSPYSKRLEESLKGLYNIKRGWYSGRYEESGKPNTAITANTNGIILEILAYKARGPLLTLATRDN